METSNRSVAGRLADLRGRLVLTRREGQRIIIGDGAERITITLQSATEGESVLAFQAPSGVPIHGEEVFARINREEQQANKGA